MITEEVLLKIVRGGVKAPSGHNVQPWMFSIENNSIRISPDFGRSLPVCDPDNHSLYISLGCALENMIIMAGAYGLRANHEPATEPNGQVGIQVTFSIAAKAEESGLFPFINRRQVNRGKYTTKPIAKSDLTALKNSSELEGVSIRYFNTPAEIESLTPFILEANRIQFSNPAFMNELVGWTRFSTREAMRTGDGIWTKTMGLPDMGRMIGSFVMKRFVTAGSEEKRLKSLIAATAGFAMFVADKNTPEGWINTGRSFQRFGLSATKLGLSHAHLNMPCEVPEVRGKMCRQLLQDGGTPLLLIRMGYAKRGADSFRRPLNSVLTQNKQ